jgi:hypothetical protein
MHLHLELANSSSLLAEELQDRQDELVPEQVRQV